LEKYFDNVTSVSYDPIQKPADADGQRSHRVLLVKSLKRYLLDCGDLSITFDAV
jgi:hypothetical protein